CGRMDKGGLGVSICMGSRGPTMDEAQGILAEYRRTLAQYMELLTGTPDRIKEMEAIYVVRGEGLIDEKMLGSVSSILTTTGLFKSEKPVIAFTMGDDGEIKFSARETQTLVDQGINLGSIMQKTAEKFSGRGGGHDVAAGAQVPKGHEIEFLNQVNSTVKEQMRRVIE
ncbi:MAG TPA: DHH family phosphoesterase, partial [archaeon]|nr:DHH family phosphoesterase [archaeon]